MVPLWRISASTAGLAGCAIDRWGNPWLIVGDPNPVAVTNDERDEQLSWRRCAAEFYRVRRRIYEEMHWLDADFEESASIFVPELAPIAPSGHTTPILEMVPVPIRDQGAIERLSALASIDARRRDKYSNDYEYYLLVDRAARCAAVVGHNWTYGKARERIGWEIFGWVLLVVVGIIVIVVGAIWAGPLVPVGISLVISGVTGIVEAGLRLAAVPALEAQSIKATELIPVAEGRKFFPVTDEGAAGEPPSGNQGTAAGNGAGGNLALLVAVAVAALILGE